jgi:GT2 family glycosyltransferase
VNSGIHAVILNFNDFDATKDCLESLDASKLAVDRIFIVDNHSGQETVDRLSRYLDSRANIRLILNEENLGFASAANIGICAALRDGAVYILLVNDDATLDPECLGHLMHALNASSDAALAGPRIFYRHDKERIWQGGGHFSRIRAGVTSPEKNKLARTPAPPPREIGFICGCVMLIDRRTLDGVGLFDQDYFLYDEDMDFCLRVIRAGRKIIYVPQARAWHDIKSVAQERTSPQTLYHLARSRLLLLRKHFSTLYFLYGLLVHLLAYTPFRLYQIAIGSRSFTAAGAWLRGTIAGLRN